MKDRENSPNKEISIKDVNEFYMLTLHLILRHDNRLRNDVVEAIRLILLKPDPEQPLSDGVQFLLRKLRDDLLDEPNQEMVSRFLSPNIRPLD